MARPGLGLAAPLASDLVCFSFSWEGSASLPTTPSTMWPVVEESGTVLVVRLDNGDTWEGPASFVRLGAAQ